MPAMKRVPQGLRAESGLSPALERTLKAAAVAHQAPVDGSRFAGTRVRVIVGQGTSGRAFHATEASGDWRTVHVGPSGLWASLPHGHVLAQPHHLNALPGQEVPAFKLPSADSPNRFEQFCAVSVYQDNVEALQHADTDSVLADAQVTLVERASDGGLHVRMSRPDGSEALVRADQVVLATGLGPRRTPADMGFPILGEPDSSLGFPQIVDGTAYLADGAPTGQDVVVYGGGGTGAWVADEVSHRAQNWCWIARAVGSGYTTADTPGGRNADVLARTEHQLRADIVGIEYLCARGDPAAAAAEAGASQTSKVKLTLRGEDGSSWVRLADQVICCLGVDARSPAAASLLDADIAREVEEMLDINQMVSNGSGVLGLATPRRDVIVAGAAVGSFAARKFDDLAMSGLPRASQVVGGITASIASIEAMNQHMPATLSRDGGFNWKLNFNTANRSQIAAYLADQQQLDEPASNLAVALIVHFRSSRASPFGLDPGQVDFIIDTAARHVSEMRERMPDFDAQRLARDDAIGAEAALQEVVGQITSVAWAATWQQARLGVE